MVEYQIKKRKLKKKEKKADACCNHWQRTYYEVRIQNYLLEAAAETKTGSTGLHFKSKILQELKGFH